MDRGDIYHFGFFLFLKMEYTKHVNNVVISKQKLNQINYFNNCPKHSICCLSTVYGHLIFI